MVALNSLQQAAGSRTPGGRMASLVIDLRGNRGGTVKSALDLAATFLPYGKALMHIHVHGKMEVFRSINRRADQKLPLLLLVDQATASASEIFSAALGENRRAQIVGLPTFGKNVAQVRLRLLICVVSVDSFRLYICY